MTPLATALRDAEGIDLSIVATNMHLSERYGMTVCEIEQAGFTVDARVPLDDAGSSPRSCVHAIAQCTDGMADVFELLRPDAVIVLGDRYEMLGVATAAMVMRIPIIHIAGGTVSEGAIDDYVRHAITKMASLHLVETDEARRRVIQMGEQPDSVITTGALGVYNILHQALMTRENLEATLDGFALSRNTILVTYHPATDGVLTSAEATDILIDALNALPHVRVLFTYPNSDAGSAEIIERIEAFVSANPKRAKAMRSLGMVRYLSALRCVGAVAGNSSSGIVEVPSMHICTVDIGPRQQGRLCADSVLHCPDNDARAIAETISRALSSEGHALAEIAQNPYYKPDTVGIMLSAITAFLQQPPTHKQFYHLPPHTS